ncbi:hypothetical protein AMJ80_09845 [bacterium SM23_31]|nr:MAG: hypothetical protein AMJ80_09845 [bacterium SM23_31]
MKTYIFITEEGITYQPNTVSPEPDIENCQVIGFAKGINEKKAIKNLVRENDYLLDTSFDEIICIELKNEDYYKSAKGFHLDDYKK